MDNSNFWWQAAGVDPGPGPGPGPDDPIGQSLRFKDGIAPQVVRNITSATTGPVTVSFWIKLANITPIQNAMIFRGDNTNVSSSFRLMKATQKLQLYSPNSSEAVETSGVYRDPAAWYHIVISSNGTDNTSVYINGNLEITSPLAFELSGWMGWGAPNQDGTQGNPDYCWSGYLADCYAIDGQALEPTAFGRYNANGVWVPREVDFAPVEMRYSDFVYGNNDSTYNPNTTDKIFLNEGQNFGPANMFNGILNDDDWPGTCKSGTGSAQTWIYWRPEPAITDVTSLSINCSNTQTVRINGGAPTGQSNTTIGNIDIANPPSTITSIAIQGNSISSATVAGIIVNGKTLLNPYIWSADVTNPDGWGTGASALSSWFDGNLTSAALSLGDGPVTFTPTGGITYTTSVRMMFNGTGTGDFRVNFNGGGEVAVPGANDTMGTWYEVDTGSGTFNSVVITRPGSQVSLVAIEIDGQVLTNGVNNSYGANGFHLTFADPSDLGKDISGNGNDFTATGFNTDPVGLFSNNCAGYAGAYNANSTEQNYEEAGPAGLFNGVTSGDGCRTPGTGFINVNFDPPLTGVTSLRIFIGYWGQVIVNETNILDFPGGNSLQWRDITSLIPANGEITQIAYGDTPATANSARANAIEVNGTILADNTGIDYDLMQDSPTQNYATLNPLGFNSGSLPSAITLTNANLGYTMSSNSDVASTFFVPTAGIYYFEFQSGSTETGFRIYAPASDNTSANGLGISADLLNQGTRYLTQGNGSLAPAGQVSKTGSANMQIAIDADNQRVYVGDGDNNWWRNNAGTYTVGAFDAAQPTIDYSGLDDNARNNMQMGFYGGSSGSLNFGQQPFLMPIPSGWDADDGLQTQNLPAAPIADGRDHFQAIAEVGEGPLIFIPIANDTTPTTAFVQDQWTYLGTTPFSRQAGNFTIDLGGSVTTTNFTYSSGSSGVEVLLSLDGTTWRSLGDQVTTGTMTWTDGNPFRFVRHYVYAAPAGYTLGLTSVTNNTASPVLFVAQQTFPNGLWWIKDRANSNQHQLVDSVRGSDLALTSPTVGDEDPYQAPAGDSVAWCWKAGDAAVANNDGSIASQVSANTDAGFSIVSYTGTGANATIGHGLNSPPEFALVKNRDGSQNWAVGGDAIDNWGTVLYLNNNQAKEPTDGGRFWNNLSPTDSVVNVGIAANTNKSGANFIAYYWHSVPGYSAFGKFTGVNDADGVFVSLGFKPAFLLIKQTNAARSWNIWDGTRNTVNPNDLVLFPDLTNGEGTGYTLDFLSNGFKARKYDFNFNSNNPYIYCAFAENPTGSSNTSPATAR